MATAKKSPAAATSKRVAPVAPAATRAAAPAPAQQLGQGPAWVATTPLRYQGRRIETGHVVPDLTAEQAAQLGDLVELAQAPAATEADATGDGASTDTNTED